MLDLLAGAHSRDIRMEPFPHIVLRDVLDSVSLDRLRATRLGAGGQTARDARSSGRRIAYSTHILQTMPGVDPLWQDFTRVQSAPAVLDRVIDLFTDILPAHCPEVWGWVKANSAPSRGLLGRDSFPEVQVLSDARLEITTPVIGEAKTHRGPHLDTANRLFTGLFYLRDSDDPLAGGNLGLYRWRGEPRETGRFQLPAEEVELAATVPYAANTLVLFPNSRRALHASTPRAPGPHERAYLFFTAEVESDLW